LASAPLHYYSPGGISPPPFDSLNLALHVGDIKGNVVENRKRVCSTIGASTRRFVAMQQAHSANVFVLKSEDSIGGFDSWQGALENVDAIVTSLHNVTLLIVAADCAMALFFDPVENVLGLVHAGWRGALMNVFSKTLQTMSREYSTKPVNVYVGIGPTISSRNYDVAKHIIYRFRRVYSRDIIETFYRFESGKYFLNIESILLFQLREMGVTNVESANLCPAENLHLFYSHHRERGVTGRFGVFAYLT
jgi:YfiH family protein